MSNSLHCLLLVLGGILICIADITAGCINSLPLNLRAFPGTDTILSSPGFPDGYQNNMVCEWRITATSGYVVRLTATYVDMEHVAGCTKDYISIYDVGNTSTPVLLGEYCNYWCTPLVSTGLQMFVRFVTDANVTDEGFQLTYTAVRPQSVPQTTPSVETQSSSGVLIATPDSSSSSSRGDLQLAIIGAVVGVVCVFGLLITVCYVVTVKKNTTARVGAMPSGAGGGLTRAGRRVAEDFVEYDNSLFMIPVPFPPHYHTAPPPAYSSDPAPTDSVEMSLPGASDAGTEVSAAAGSGNEASVVPSAPPSTVITSDPPHASQLDQ